MHPQNTHVTHSQKLADVVAATKALLDAKVIHPNHERAAIRAQLAIREQAHSRQGVNFSRSQITALLQARDSNCQIEFETLGPYLSNYLAAGGLMTKQTLVSEDNIGLQLARLFREIFPKARLVSLYDEHNKKTLNVTGEEGEFTDVERQRFKQSLVKLFKDEHAVRPDAIEGIDYLLIAESSKLADAPKMVEALEAKGYIKRKGEEILFVNSEAENPLYTQITLRTKQGRWLCEALDASGFLKPENARITHIVVLPDYMSAQQDKVWEIVRVLGFPPNNYHNIFFDPAMPAENIVEVVKEEFARYDQR